MLGRDMRMMVFLMRMVVRTVMSMVVWMVLAVGM
jgi:hypothetical protein